MKTGIGRLAPFVAFALMGCGGGGGSDSSTFAVEGRVLNGVVVGSTVEVFGANGGSVLGTATTDATGRFSARVPQRGPYRLSAEGGQMNGADYSGVLEASCAAGSGCFVTPYSTVLLRLVDEHGFNTGDAAGLLANRLGFDGDPFVGDVPAQAFELDAARLAIAGGDGLAAWVAGVVAWATDETEEPPPGMRVPPPTDGEGADHGDGTEPGPGDGTEPGPGDGTEPGPGDGTEPGPGDGTEPGPGDGTEPGPGDGTEPGPGIGNGDTGNGGERPVTAQFDTKNLFQTAANLNDAAAVEAALAALDESWEDAGLEVFEAIDGVLTGSVGIKVMSLASVAATETRNGQDRQQQREERRQRVAGSDSQILAVMETSVMPAGSVACYQDQGTFKITETIAVDEDFGETEGSSSESLSLDRSVEFVNCAVPVDSEILTLNGAMSITLDWAYAWDETSDQWQESERFMASLKGTLNGRENAFVMDGSAQLEFEEACTWTASGESCRGTEEVLFPRLEMRWEPVAGVVNYLGRLNLRLDDVFEDEWDQMSDTWIDEFSISGQFAASGLNGNLTFRTPKAVRTVETFTYDGGDFEFEFTPVCAQSGIIQFGAAELRFGEDTGVSGSAFQIVTGSGESRNWPCGDPEIEEVLDRFEPILIEPVVEYLLFDVGSGEPRW